MNVYTARWLLPVTAPPIRDGAVGVDPYGRIAYVGLAAGAPDGARYPLGDAILMPGIVAVAGGALSVGLTLGPAYQIDEDLLIDLCASAVGAALPVALTVGADPDEVAFLREARGPHADARRAAGVDVVRRAHSAVHLLAELGIAAVARPLLVGGAYFDASDVALAAYYDCPVAYAPANPGEPDPAPYRALVDAGVRVALATDDPLGLAARLAPDATRAVRLATLDGARALGVDAEVGSLDVGKLADLCAFPLSPDDRRTADARGPEHALLARPRGRAVLRIRPGHAVRPGGV